MNIIHVMDLAVAHFCALRHLALGREGLALNLGTGKGVSVREVVAMVEKTSGRRIPTRETPQRPGDPATLFAKTVLANRVLHWQPNHSNMEATVRSAKRWHSRGRKETADLEALHAAQHRS